MAMQTPPPALAPLVRSIWSLAGPPSEASLPGIIVPDAHVEFVFHLGETWRMRRAGAEEWLLQPRAFVYAQQKGALSLQPTGAASLVAFRVTPVVARRLLGCSLADLWDEPIPLQSLIGCEATSLLDALQRAKPTDLYGVLQDWIVRRLDAWSADDWAAQRLYNTILWRSRTGSIAQVAGNLGPSSRSLRRVFESRVGLSPKAVQLSGRVLSACGLLREQPGLEITDIASRVGFFDHAAFTHSFAARVGLTPSQFRGEPHAYYERE
jgi:AraC-like DNA-binding protein